MYLLDEEVIELRQPENSSGVLHRQVAFLDLQTQNEFASTDCSR